MPKLILNFKLDWIWGIRDQAEVDQIPLVDHKAQKEHIDRIRVQTVALLLPYKLVPMLQVYGDYSKSFIHLAVLTDQVGVHHLNRFIEGDVDSNLFAILLNYERE